MDTGSWHEAVFLYRAFGVDRQHGRTIADLRCCRCSMNPVRAKGLQFPHFGSVWSSGSFVISQATKWHSCFGKGACFLSGDSATVGLSSKGFGSFASDSPSAGHHFSAAKLRPRLLTVAIGPGLGTNKRVRIALIFHDGVRRTDGDGRHVLHTTSYHQIRGAGHHRLGCIVYGLLARTTLAIDRGTRDSFRPAGS